VRLLDTYVVHTKTGQSIRGAVRRKRGAWVVLANAVLLDGQREAITLDGDVSIPRDNIDFAQRTKEGTT
jgi:hypothetical protein